MVLWSVGQDFHEWAESQRYQARADRGYSLEAESTDRQSYTWHNHGNIDKFRSSSTWHQGSPTERPSRPSPADYRALITR